ncbi:MAG TPA: M23 family metallopeptidase [Microcoleaceae cyanobacterium]|jgi:murein DD-endopeptidase MepM/ murein hydrolase activator NlpD
MTSIFPVSQPLTKRHSLPRSLFAIFGPSFPTWAATLASLAGTTITLAAALPAQALQVQVTPTNPQLGDTLTVVAAYDNPAISATPTVTLGGQTYQTFLIGANRFRALLPTTPLDRPGKLPIQVSGEGQTQTVTVALQKRSFPTQSIWLPPGKDEDISDYEFNLVDAFKKLVTPQKFWNGAFLRPNQGEITTIYGVQRYYNGKFAQDYYHRGVDYAGGYGSPVIAPAAGRVALVGREAQGFKINGNVVGIDHGQGVVSIFLHLSRINVKEGDMVNAGQVIGAVGATGAAAGPHLHWGLYVQGQSVDPVPWRTKSFE